ncbi:SusC/RagA family TonB-linked outer membrane protein [Flavobacterium sp. XS2P39]|uniref:SusC/RagA family TonB-linked outer membrane protein n=1 Tax=Flavobacterium sp. XS2P39 TaxID=3401725 RepID=UPI003AAA43A0
MRKTLTTSMLLFLGIVSYSQEKDNSKLTDSLSKAKELDAVVIIGYGTAKKADLTGSVAVINADVIAKQPNGNVVSSLQGRVAGVQINNSGKVGGAPSIKIRGVSSTSDKILYVIDGVLTNDISFLNPNDVETISVLKDASSSAIYGIQAANGVIIIKTKTGKKGQSKITYDNYIGFQNVQNVPKLTNATDYITLVNEKILYDTGTAGTYKVSDYKGNTDWFKEVMKKSSQIQSHNLGISGGSENATYSLGLGYLNQEGNIKAKQNVNTGDDYDRVTVKFNTNFNVNKNFKMGFNTVYYDYNKNNSLNPYGQAYAAAPVIPVYDASGNYGSFEAGTATGSSATKNPRAYIDLFRGKTKGRRLLVGGFGEYTLMKNLTFKLSYNKDVSSSKTYEFYPSYGYGIFTDGIWSSQKKLAELKNQNNNQDNWVWDNTLNYKFDLKENHHFSVLAGYSKQEYFEEQLEVTGQDVSFNGSDSELYLDLAKGGYSISKDGTYGTRNRFLSYYGRLMYNFNEKYLFNATLRRDGASNFNFNGNQKFEIFPSVGLGWIISKEDFFSDVKSINFLKLKGSWGKLGNANVPRSYDPVATDPTSATFGSSIQSGRSITDIVDSTIGWEMVEETDFGLESRMFDNKLTFEAGYYNKTTSDAIATIRLLSTSGDSDLTTNVASFQNKGFEFDIKWNDQINDNLKYGFYGNVTTIKNEITEVLGGSFQNMGGIYNHSLIRMEKGAEVGSYYGYTIDGVYQTDAEAADRGLQAGDLKFTDLNNDGVISELDKTFLGSPIPSITYGFGAYLDYRNFDFSMDFQGVAGNEIYNINRQTRYDAENFTQDFFDNRWHGQGTSTSYPSASADQNNQLAVSSLYVEKGDYLRVRSIQLGYTVPKSIFKNKIDRLRLYVNTQNPFTFSNYKGFSPEINNTNNGVWEAGIDSGIHPVFATYNFGINLNF